jgi:hypothetical protein
MAEKAVAVYVTSAEAFSGKSSLCVGLGLRLRRDGFNVGYMKPISSTAKRIKGRAIDEDVEVIKELFQLEEDSETLAPVCLDPLTLESILKGERIDVKQRIKKAYEQASKDKDVMLLGGGASLTDGALVGLPSQKVAELLGAWELVIIRYEDDLSLNSLLLRQEVFGESMLGAVLNTVPKRRLEYVRRTVRPFLEDRGIKVYAVLPEERILLSMSVGELAEVLGGRILNSPEKADELVEHLMIGAMSVDSALSYFRRKPHKAVITGGDRPDIQLAALETSTKCLILTGNLYPNAVILARAEELGVPMILVGQDTLTAVEIIERYFGKTRFHQKKKIERFEKLLEKHFDFEGLYKALGLRAR